jgi:hypothetical protein
MDGSHPDPPGFFRLFEGEETDPAPPDLGLLRGKSYNLRINGWLVPVSERLDLATA